MRAWIFQDTKQKKSLGDKAPWSVGWYDGNGRRRSKRIGLKSQAQQFRSKREVELAAGLCTVGPPKIPWQDFADQYEQTIMPKWRSGASRVEAKRILRTFADVARPKYVYNVDSQLLDRFVAKRLEMPGKKKGDKVSPETVRKELRTVRAALGVAVRWKYLAEVPLLPEIDGYGKDKPFVLQEDFIAIMQHCDVASLPSDQHYTAEAFWQALLFMAWITGMRKTAMLSLRWDDLDFDAGIVLSRYRDNKQKRDQRHKIRDAVPLLRDLFDVRKPGDGRVFPWNHCIPTLDRTLVRIQQAAGIHLPCREEHEHTDRCHVYGFHSFRYAHATYNGGRVPDRDLQEQMGHASFNTTLRYIKYASTHQERSYDAYVPDSIKTIVA